LPGELWRFHPYVSLRKLSEKRGDPVGRGYVTQGVGVAVLAKSVNGDIPAA